MEKVIVITGGTKGIGRVVLNHFAEKGYSAYFCGRSYELGISIATSLKTRYPNQFFEFIKTDLSIESEVTTFCETILRKCTSIQVLINNAGIFEMGNFENTSVVLLDKMYSVNVKAPFIITQKLLPLLKNNSNPQIFILCSKTSQEAMPHAISYSISKYAVYGFVKNLRKELQSIPIKVTAILPGSTFSDSWLGTGVNPLDLAQSSDLALGLEYVCNCSPYSNIDEIHIYPAKGEPKFD